MYDPYTGFGLACVHDTIIVQFFWDQRVTEFTKPEFEKGGEDGWVVESVEGVDAFVDTEFEVGDCVTVSGDSEDTFGFGPTQGEDTVREEWEDDGDFELGIGAFLESENDVEGFAKDGRVEGCVLQNKVFDEFKNGILSR